MNLLKIRSNRHNVEYLIMEDRILKCPISNTKTELIDIEKIDSLSISEEDMANAVISTYKYSKQHFLDYNIFGFLVFNKVFIYSVNDILYYTYKNTNNEFDVLNIGNDLGVSKRLLKTLKEYCITDEVRKILFNENMSVIDISNIKIFMEINDKLSLYKDKLLCCTLHYNDKILCFRTLDKNYYYILVHGELIHVTNSDLIDVLENDRTYKLLISNDGGH